MPDAKILGMPKKTAIIFGIGGVAALGALLWYRHRQAAGAGTAAAPATTDTSIDPQTGYPYGTPEDQAALASLNGGGYGAYGLGTGSAIDPNTGIPYSEELAGVGAGAAGGGTVGATGPAGPTGATGPAGPGGPPAVHTNTAWAQAGEEHLGGGATVSAALHKYISGGAMTPDQAQIANNAISWLGYPPQRGSGGYPPAMRTQPHPGHQGGKTKIVTAPGGLRFEQLAPRYHTTYDELRKLNPAFAVRFMGRAVPKGIRFRVPA